MNCPAIKRTALAIGPAFSSLLAGCAADRIEFSENAVALIIAEENAAYIRQAGIYREKDRVVVMGLVRRGM